MHLAPIMHTLQVRNFLLRFTSKGIYACSWSPDSKQVLTASGDKTCKIWDAETGECLKYNNSSPFSSFRTFTVTANPQVEHQMLGCLWQNDEIISVALSGDIYYHDINNPSKPKRVVHGHNKFITALAYDSQNKALYSGSYDGLIDILLCCSSLLP